MLRERHSSSVERYITPDIVKSSMRGRVCLGDDVRCQRLLSGSTQIAGADRPQGVPV